MIDFYKANKRSAHLCALQEACQHAEVKTERNDRGNDAISAASVCIGRCKPVAQKPVKENEMK